MKNSTEQNKHVDFMIKLEKARLEKLKLFSYYMFSLNKKKFNPPKEFWR